MDATLRALGEILLNAVPTFLLVVLLHFYLKKVFFQPMEKVLRQRFEATEGARKLADQALERASARVAEYEAVIRSARSEIYQAQEKFYKELQDQQAAQIADARLVAEAGVRETKAQLSRETEEARATLVEASQGMADDIANSMLRGTAA